MKNNKLVLASGILTIGSLVVGTGFLPWKGVTVEANEPIQQSAYTYTISEGYGD